MTLAEAGIVFAYWSEHPPAHLIVQVVARLLGWKPRGTTAPPDDRIAAAPPPGLIVAGGGLDMPTPELDVERMRARNHAHLAKRVGSL